MPGRSKIAGLVAALAPCLALGSCSREDRTFRPAPGSAEAVQWTRISGLRAGGAAPGPGSGMVASPGPGENAYAENAYALAEGQRLFAAYNCVGCHSHGGGGMGPALIDVDWIYGSDPNQIFSTLVQGRPNGMPSFGGRIPASQLWQLVAFVRGLGGLVAKDAAPGRDDHMHGAPPENSVDAPQPKEPPR